MSSASQDGSLPDIDSARLQACLDVLAEVDQLSRVAPEHPDAVLVRRATAQLFKTVKESRRASRRAAVLAADRTVTEATATAAPGRIDDETNGAELRTSSALPSSTGATSNGVGTGTGTGAGRLLRSRACYICKNRYVDVDAFYHQLCPPCAELNHGRRGARTDLVGRRALLTGGRAKIGMYIGLRLLRDGAHTTVTTRFPHDAVRRFTSLHDSADWLDRLTIIGIDLRDPAQVVALAESVAAQGPLDILINNAAQTVRRSPGSYAPLLEAERDPLPAGPLPKVSSYGETSQAHPAALVGAMGRSPGASTQNVLALAAKRQSAIDAAGLLPDLQSVNSWTQRVGEVDALELLEVQLCNTTAPFILINALRPSMAAATARRKYIVNVSAMEGQFSRAYKGPGHPHTNMAKAALNMLTRTSAAEMLSSDGILMTAVDTGWITDERPHPTRQRLYQEGFHAPLDLVDGAARIYDPIVAGEAGRDLFGCVLKDYAPAAW